MSLYFVLGPLVLELWELSKRDFRRPGLLFHLQEKVVFPVDGISYRTRERARHERHVLVYTGRYLLWKHLRWKHLSRWPPTLPYKR